MTIQKNIAALFSNCCSKPLSITKIQGDASSRQYFRVTGTNDSAVACYDQALNTSSADTYPFLLVHTLLSRHALPVPAIMAIDAEKNLLLLEDCGDLLLQNIFNSSREQTLPDRYREIIDILVQLQAIRGAQRPDPLQHQF